MDVAWVLYGCHMHVTHACYMCAACMLTPCCVLHLLFLHQLVMVLQLLESLVNSLPTLEGPVQELQVANEPMHLARH